MKTVRDVSAGGVVYRRVNSGAEVALVGRLRPERWALPKGTPHRGEPLEQAALREVEEETGLQARIVTPLGEVEYWFAMRGVRHHKLVHFYLMELTGGDISRHDHEYDVVAWFPIEQVRAKMAYPNEIRIVEQVVRELQERGVLQAID